MLTKAMEHKNSPAKVFDWVKAAQLILERQPTQAAAGLSEDWFRTADDIYLNGKMLTDADAYLVSLWATPAIEMDGVREACYLEEQDKGKAGRKVVWPPEARAILDRDNLLR